MFADVFLLRDQDLFEPLRLDLLHLDHHHSNNNNNINNNNVGGSNNRGAGVVGIRNGGIGAFSQGKGQGLGLGRSHSQGSMASYVMHSLGLCEALTHRLARHTSPCLGSDFAAVFSVRVGGADQVSNKHQDEGLNTGVIRSSGWDKKPVPRGVMDKEKDKDKDEEDDVFRIDNDEIIKAGGLPQAVAGVVGSITQSWRIMKRLVAEVH